jgi:two-component system NarL family response regulator
LADNQTSSARFVEEKRDGRAHDRNYYFHLWTRARHYPDTGQIQAGPCALYDQLSPDVLLLDLRMPKKDGLQVLAELMSRRGAKPRIIVMTAYESEADIRQALKAGAKAFLVKGAHPQQIREAVRRVASGESFLPAEIAFKLAESMSHPELTAREFQVLRHLAAGGSNKEIGQKLFITEHTIKAHVKSILTKLDALGRTQAIAIATKRGLLLRS